MPQSTPMSKWDTIRAKNPDHSEWYYTRFETMRAEGADLLGEARFIDMLAPRGAMILDAGCGPGRHVRYLDDQGHTTVGVDGDEILIGHAKEANDTSLFICQNLANLDMAVIDLANADVFDIIYAAGNVMTFLHPDTVEPIVARFFELLKPGGRFVCGFGAERGLAFDAFRDICVQAGFTVEHELATWHLDPLVDDSDFYVPVLRKPL